MDGSFTKRDDGRWMGRIQINNKKYSVYGKTKTEAKKKIATLIEKHELGAEINPIKYTVESFSTLWLNSYLKLKVRANSFLWKEGLVKNHILPVLGPIPLQQLATSQVKLLIQSKIDSGLSTNTVQKIRHTLHGMLAYAVDLGIIIKNCTDTVNVKTIRNPEVVPLTLSQLKDLLAEAKPHKLYPAILILATTGVRRSELCGLKWSDINWDNETAHVQRAVVKLGGYGILINETKNHSSRRLIPLSPEVITCLKKRVSKIGYIFDRPDGQPIYPESIYDYIKRIGKKLNMPHITLHTLRHTVATLLLGSGENPKIVQELLGHASISTTLDIYSHVVPGLKKQAVNTLSNMLQS